MWLEIGKNLVTSLPIIAAVTYLAKVLITQLFSKDLEKFKADLVIAAQRENNLYSKRGVVIDELYGQLCEAEESYISVIKSMQFAGEPSLDEKKKILEVAHNNFLKYYQRKKIFFSEDLCEKIDKLISSLLKIYQEFETYDGTLPKPDKWSELWENLSSKLIPQIKLEIEDEFRSLIGVSKD